MTIKEAVIKYIEYRHSLGEKFKSAGILLVSFSKFIGDTTDISSINMESVNSFLYKGNRVTGYVVCSSHVPEGILSMGFSTKPY